MTEQAASASGTGREARKWAMISHLIALVGLLGNGIGFLIGPLAVWLIKREDDPFIDEQGKEAVNFQITMLIASVICIPFFFILIGVVMLFACIVVDVILAIIAAMKANEGVHYRYPFAIRLIK